MALVSSIADRMGVKTEVDPEVDELKQDVAPEAVLDEIEERKRWVHEHRRSLGGGAATIATGHADLCRYCRP
jgi:hypothetical protein